MSTARFKVYTEENSTACCLSWSHMASNISPFDSQSRDAESGRSLHQQLWIAILPVVLVPLLVAGGLSWRIAYQQAKTRAEQRLSQQSLLAAKLTERVLTDALQIPAIVASSPSLIQAARAGAATAESEELPALGTDRLEQRFSQTRLLNANQTLNDYLRRVADRAGFAEIFATDRHGFNIAYSNLTSDFVQSDETWWQQGRQAGEWIGQPQLDRSSNVFSIDLVRAINDPDTGEFLGVVNGVFATANFEALENALLGLELRGSETLQIVQIGDRASTIETLDADGATPQGELVGGETIATAARSRLQGRADDSGSISLAHQNRYYVLHGVSNTDWAIVASIEISEIRSAGNELALTFTIIFVVLAIVAAIAIQRLAHHLSQPLSELTRAVQQIAIGNLDTSAVARGTSETRTLARSFNQMVARVKEFLREKEGVGEHAMQLLGEVQEIADSIQGVAANTQQAERRVRQINQTVRASDDAMNQTVASIDTIQDTVTEMARKVRQLGETSQRISRAIVLIKQFSTQTNLLALNASVEASRAGKFGQGFAVVAKEIRALANQSADATQEIELLVNEIQTGTRNVAIAMEAGTQQVDAGTQWVETSRKQLIQLAQTIAEIDTLVAEIARAASAQAQTSASVSASIRDVVDISRNERDKTSEFQRDRGDNAGN